MTAWFTRSIPAPLAWSLPVYLALVARHLIAPSNRVAERPTPAPSGAQLDSTGDSEPVKNEIAPVPEPIEEAGPISSDLPPPSVRAPALRPRRKPRTRVIAEPAPAAWVQVAPGRFVRAMPPEPAPIPEETEMDQAENIEDCESSSPAEDSSFGPEIDPGSI